jgi:hypothetical protein
MNLPGFTAEFSLYGDAADHYRRGFNRSVEQHAVIPQMSLINVLCAEEYASCRVWCSLTLTTGPGYCECLCRNIYCTCGGRRCVPKMCEPWS